MKHDENVALYGNEWFFANPNPFTTQIDIKFLGRADGSAKVELINPVGRVIASQNFITGKEEVYNYTFSNLANLPAGFYAVKYADRTLTKTISLQKGNIFAKDWLIAIPNPFTHDLPVYVKAQESGEISLRLIDAKGSVAEVVTQQITQNEVSTIRFKKIVQLPRGIYFLQYISKTQNRTIQLIKG